VIEEIQLEPIPEYLSNQRMERNKRRTDNSMLLLDEDQLSDRDLPPSSDIHAPNVRTGKKKE